MTQAQVKELFGVAPSTLKDWKNNPNHEKHALGLFLVSLEYEPTKKRLDELKIKG